MDSENVNVGRRVKLIWTYIIGAAIFTAMAGVSLLGGAAWTYAFLGGVCVMGVGLLYNATIIMETTN